MITAGELWPSRDEYDLAVSRWTETIFDPALRGGKLDYDHLGIRRYGGANLYVCIYKISGWMIRCFCSNGQRQPPADIKERYRAIAQFSQQYSGRVSALAPVSFYDQGIRVGTRNMPLVKMPFFAACPSLGEFIMDHYTEQGVMQQLCDAWLRMIIEMEAAALAHGDLDLSNVLVDTRGPSLALRLIDYDDMWIPSLAGRDQTEYGHQHFQHPAFMPPNPRPFAVNMDRFSALVIYISLKTLVSQPQLYDQWGADESERLLFADTDYQNALHPGNRIALLRQISAPDLHPCIDELLAALRERRMPRSLAAIAPPPSQPLQPAQPVEYRPTTPLAPSPPTLAAPPPPRALWGKAVYNTQAPFPFPSPPVQPAAYNGASAPGMAQAPRPPAPASAAPGPVWAERTGFNPSLPPLSRPQGPDRYSEDSATRPAASSPAGLPVLPTPVTMPPSQAAWNTSAPAVAQMPSPVPAQAIYTPPPGLTSVPGMSNPTPAASFPPPSTPLATWNHAPNGNGSPAPGGFIPITPRQQVPASPPSVAAGDDAPRPLDFVQSQTKAASLDSKRRLLIWIIIVALIVIILGSILALAILLLPGLLLGNTAGPTIAANAALAIIIKKTCIWEGR